MGAMTNEKALESSPRPKNSDWEICSKFFTQNPLGTFLINFLSGVMLMVVSYYAGKLNILGLQGRCVQERERQRALLAAHDNSTATLRECLEYIQRALAEYESKSAERDREHADEISSLRDQVDQKDQAQAALISDIASSIQESMQRNNSNCNHDPSFANPAGWSLQAPVRIYSPSSERSKQDAIIDTAESSLGSEFQSVRGSRILQSMVEVRDDILPRLQRCAEACTEVDDRVTLQLGDCQVFVHTDEGVQMWELDPSHCVPVILHSAYAAGKLTIEGLNLDKSTLKAATFDKCFTLRNVNHKQVQNGLEICTWIVQLPSNNLEEVFVYATKKISIKGSQIVICSSIVKIQDNNLRTVVRFGIPSIILLIFIVRHLYYEGFQLINASNLEPYLAWMIPLLIIILSQLLPLRTENMIRALLEYIRLVILSLYFSSWTFCFKQNSEFGNEVSSRTRQKLKKKPLEGEAENSTDDAINNVGVGVILRETLSQFTKAMSEIKRDIKSGIKDAFREELSEVDFSDDCEGEETNEQHQNINDREWQWQAYEEYSTKSGAVKLKRCGDSKNEDTSVKKIPFDVIYGLKEKKWAQRDYVIIFSPLLIDIIVALIPESVYSWSEGQSKVFASQLFHIREKLEEIRLKGVDEVLPEIVPSSEEDQAKQQLHLNHLLEYMDKEFKDILKMYSVIEDGRRLSWDMLWAFFPSGIKVIYHCDVTNDEVLGIVQTTSYKAGIEGEYFSISIRKWDYDCDTWRAYATQRKVNEYDGDHNFTSLPVWPLRFQNAPETTEKDFLVKGERFCYLSMLARNRFMNYKGLIYMRGCGMLSKETADGRVMIDLGSFAKMNPSYEMGSAQPPCEVLRDNKVKPVNITSSPDRMYAPAMVYGFSFRLKKWGTFLVCGFDEIVFNESAFGALVMDSKKKELVYQLVREYLPKKKLETLEANTDAGQVDPIASKGEGCIILCYGPPGTGKTLTAESIAESLHAPLWSLSVSELGTSPKELESYLVKVLDVASTWGAILLLDEADVYLEKRSPSDLTRTAMTGIFLRNLEYYRGVLFLTTNRIVEFDEAFRSRLSMILYYGMHSATDRRKIWETTLSRVNMENLPENLLATYSEQELNGRDIRNVVQKAMILARSNGERLMGKYITQSLDDMVESLDKLKSVCSEDKNL